MPRCYAPIICTKTHKKEGGLAIKTKQIITHGEDASTKRSAQQDVTNDLLFLIQKSLDDLKGDDIRTIDLRHKSTMADAMVVATGTSDRHVESLARNVINTLSRYGYGVQGIEGIPGNEWVLVDAGDVIVHVFLPEMRGIYNLEKMWSHQFDDDGAEPSTGLDLAG